MRNVTVIPNLRETNPSTRAKIVKEQLAKPIHEILTRQGDLPREGIQYFLGSSYGIVLSVESAGRALRMLSESSSSYQMPPECHIESYWHSETGNEVYTTGLKDKKGNPLHRIKIDVPDDYAHAYYGLQLRYQAIREHPELATMSEKYIDSLYNPKIVDWEDDS